MKRSAIVLGALLACAWPAAPGQAHVPADAVGGRALGPAPAPAATVAARQRFFGSGNVDAQTGAVRPDRLILSWFGVTNFAVAIRGHVLLFDAWVARGVHSGYVPTTPEELAALAPDAILLGHAHFDHAADAVPIAQASGAKLVGTAEHCAELAARAGGAFPLPCLAAVPGGAEPGHTAEVELLGGVEIRAVKHVHSAARAPDGSDQGGYHVPVIPFPATTVLDHPPTPADVAHLAGHAPDAEGGSVLYRLKTGGLTLVWHDTSGPLAEDAPEAFEALRALRPVDIQVGAIQGFNQLSNGFRDPRQYIEAIAPRMFVPGHHDDWLPGITTTADGYEAPFRAELERLPAQSRPEIRFIRDPADYIRPDALSFPLQLPLPRLAISCRRGVLRLSLSGDPVAVRSVTFSAAGRRARPPGPPFRASFRRVRGGRAKARLILVDGMVKTLSRRAPRCVRGR